MEQRFSNIWFFVTKISEGTPEGVIFSPYLSEFVEFKSDGQLLFLIEQILDATGAPKRFFNPRTVEKDILNSGKDGIPEWINSILLGTPNFDLFYLIPKNTLYTFIVNIVFRQNCSWQGKITQVVKRGKGISFRSALEMILIIKQIFALGGDEWLQKHFYKKIIKTEDFTPPYLLEN